MWWVLFGLWSAGVTALSAMPGGTVNLPVFPHADKLAHFGMFFVGAFILAAALRQSFRWSPWVVVPAVIAVMAVLGAIDEWHQLFTPGRSGGDLGDWMADSLGGICGVLALYAWHGFVRLIIRPQSPAVTPAAD